MNPLAEPAEKPSRRSLEYNRERMQARSRSDLAF